MVRLIQAALAAQDAEREKLAYEVHDRIAQSLVTIFQQLQLVEVMTEALPDVHRAVVRCSSLTRQVTREVRHIIHDLYPPGLAEMGLKALLADDLRHMANETGCQVVLDTPLQRRLRQETELVIYRIFREALTNVQRHAQAQQVRVSLQLTAQEVCLEVQDDGTGFDLSAQESRRIGGLRSMHRRAELAGGHCRIESAPRRGTTVVVRLPYVAD
ncbi:MAG: ATP-binding protein [Chloroflexi bacterium]|nr:ATP-binding protein [Chloroflexota bacterium]